MEKQNAEEEAWKHEESKKEASEASQSCISGAGTKTVEYRPCTVKKRWSNYHPELIQKDLYIYPYIYIQIYLDIMCICKESARERERERFCHCVSLFWMDQRKFGALCEIGNYCVKLQPFACPGKKKGVFFWKCVLESAKVQLVLCCSQFPPEDFSSRSPWSRGCRR